MAPRELAALPHMGAQLLGGLVGQSMAGRLLHFPLLCSERQRQTAKPQDTLYQCPILHHSRAAYACWSTVGQSRSNSPIDKGHNPST